MSVTSIIVIAVVVVICLGVAGIPDGSYRIINRGNDRFDIEENPIGCGGCLALIFGIIFLIVVLMMFGIL